MQEKWPAVKIQPPIFSQALRAHAASNPLGGCYSRIGFVRALCICGIPQASPAQRRPPLGWVSALNLGSLLRI
ncbi:MAG: hypothetical protein B7Y53_01875 [Halothiobacillus sp. 28-55-5]|nr:MAG: hypothetical protein B7Y53_01875 [Halothiobacillus sp. 28-55-5]